MKFVEVKQQGGLQVVINLELITKFWLHERAMTIELASGTFINLDEELELLKVCQGTGIELKYPETRQPPKKDPNDDFPETGSSSSDPQGWMR
jgi:hypothetical protein